MRGLAVALVGGLVFFSQGCSVSNSSLTNAPPATAASKTASNRAPIADPGSASLSLNAPLQPVSEPGAPPRAPVKIG